MKIIAMIWKNFPISHENILKKENCKSPQASKCSIDWKWPNSQLLNEQPSSKWTDEAPKSAFTKV